MSRTVDVIVVGSGAGGLSAAIVAASKGLSVLVVEKSEYLGGTTAMSGGGVWIPANSLMKAAGEADSAERALDYLKSIVDPAAGTERLQAFLDDGPAAIDYLQAHSLLEFSTRKYSPDYHSEHPSATRTSRAIDIQPFDGTLLGEDLARLQPPRAESLLFGGLSVNGTDLFNLLNARRSWACFAHSVRLIGRYATQRFRHGQCTRLVLGRAMVARMLATLREAEVPLETSTPVVELIVEDGRVVGVVTSNHDRRESIRARRGVVLATGGFAHDAALRKRWIPSAEQHLSVGSTGNSGDGVSLAIAAGGSLSNAARDSAYWTPVSRWLKPDGSQALFPHLVTDRAKPGLIAIDATGRRFTNESDSYHDFVRAMHARQADLASTSHPRAGDFHLIADKRFVDRYGLGHARPQPFPRGRLIADGYLVTAPTLAELASKLGVDGAAFALAVARHNEQAAQGSDTDFGKGSSRYNRFMGDATHEPNPCLASIAVPPFHAVKVFPGDVGTSRGVTTDRHARVLDDAGVAIEGLYAAGNDADSVLLGSYPGPGASLGPALTAGYVCAMHMAHHVAAETPSAFA